MKADEATGVGAELPPDARAARPYQQWDSCNSSLRIWKFELVLEGL